MNAMVTILLEIELIGKFYTFENSIRWVYGKNHLNYSIKIHKKTSKNFKLIFLEIKFPSIKKFH